MKIYFAGSIRAGREDVAFYATIVRLLSKYGTVLTEHIGDPAISSYGELNLSDKQIFERDMAWLQEADVVVAEVSTPSLGVGYELGRAESLGKPILCLHHPSDKPMSAMLAGDERLKVREYKSSAELGAILHDFFS